MTEELPESIYLIVPSVANVVLRRFRGWVDREDLMQECYVKNRIKEVQEEMKNILLILMESGLVEIREEDGKKVYKVNKIK